MKSAMVLTLAVTVALGGCATKRYGRAVGVSEFEGASYSCREIDIEMAKVQAFRDQIASGSKIDTAAVLGFLGDFGIGNAMERSAAEKSAAARMEQLRRLKETKGCQPAPLG